MASPCANCTMGCCRQYIVTITGYDMWVISRGLNMAPEQFTVVVPAMEPGPRGFLLDSSNQYFNIALDKRPAKTDEKPCVFWLEFPDGLGRCGIYPLRPYVCQTYPANFAGNTVVHRREDVPCPTDAWRDGRLQHPLWRGRLIRTYVEFDIYALAVSRWNYHAVNTPRPEGINALSYFNFVLHYYSRLEAVRARVGKSEWAAMCEQWCECLMQDTSPVVDDLEVMRPWATVVEEISEIAFGFFPDDLIEEPVAVLRDG